MSRIGIKFLENYKQMKIKKLQREEKHESNKKERELEVRENEPFLKFFTALVLLYYMYI